MQVFVGTVSHYIHGYECRSDKEFARILEDDIRFHGAPNRIVSDLAKAEISKKVEEVLRKYMIDSHQSEAYQQQQNPVERSIQDIKRYANYVADYSGAPPESWVLIIHYVTYIMNRTARSVLNYRTPYEKLYGQTPDISVMTQFQFWEPVLIHDHLATFPSTSLVFQTRLEMQDVIKYIMYRLARLSAGHYCSVSMNANMKSIKWNHIRRAQMGSQMKCLLN